MLTLTLAQQMEAAVLSFALEKMQVLTSLPENPYQVEVRQWGDIISVRVPHTHNNQLFNFVRNIKESNLCYIPDILNWYAEASIYCTFTIPPYNAHPELLKLLARQGFFHCSFTTVLYGLAESLSLRQFTGSHPDIHIRSALAHECAEFADTYLECFNIPNTDEYKYAHDAHKLLIGRPHIHCLVATLDDEIAGICILYVHDDIGYLALAATKPAFQNQGCQKALIQARILLAREYGCKYIVAQADFLNTSCLNMQKSGLQIAYTKALWTKYQ